MDHPNNVVKLPEAIKFRDHMQCPKCHATAELSCACGVQYVYVTAAERATQILITNPEKSNRAIAKEIGVSNQTVMRAREASAPNGAPEKRVGLDGRKQSATKRPKSTKRIARDTMAQAVIEAQAASPWPLTPGQRWAVKAQVMGIVPPMVITNSKSAKPIGRMPDDTREKFEAHMKVITDQLVKLHKLMDYANQMSEPLRHRLAGRLKEIKGHADELARAMLGSNDLRKITTTLCHVDIPLRKDDTNPQLPEEGYFAATVDEQSG
jgi:hypothetical protein